MARHGDSKSGAASRLFSRQVLERNNGLCGPLVINAPPNTGLLVISAMVTSAAVILMLFEGTYAARLPVNGYLHSTSSVLQVRAARDGQLGQVFVTPETRVNRGQPLFELLDSDQSTSAVQVAQVQMAGLTQRRSLLQDRHLAMQQIRELKRQGIDREITSLGDQLQQLLQQTNLLSQQLVDRTRQAQALQTLEIQGYAGTGELANYRDHVLASRLSLLEKQQQVTSNRQRQAELRQKLAILAREQDADNADFRVQDTELDGRETQLQLARSRTVLAPRDATVGEVYAFQGAAVGARQAILSLYQADGPLSAELAVPARIMPASLRGMKVRITLLDALAPAKATFVGTVVDVSATPVPAGTRMGPLTVAEASFRARVSLQPLPHHIQTDGFASMHRMITAQLIGRPRSLIQWLLNPLVQLRQAVT